MKQFWLVTIASCLLVLGCNSAAPVEDTSEAYLSAISQIYFSYESVHAGSPPSNEDEFKQYAKEGGQFATSDLGLENSDDLFVCKRDGSPIVLLFGKDSLKYNGTRIIAHEKSAVGGKIWAATKGGGAVQIEEAEFAKLKN